MTKSLNILHVFPSSHAGGSELCAVESIQALNSLGVNNYALVPRDGEIVDKLKSIEVQVGIIPNDWWVTIKPWSYLLKIKMLLGYYKSSNKISKFIVQNKIDVVITHTLTIPSAALAAYRIGVPHLWYIHEYGVEDHRLKFEYGREWSLKYIDKLSDVVVVNSKALYSHFSKYINKDKLRLVYYAVDYPVYNPLIIKKENTLNICMVGRIAPGKNQMLALRALVYLQSFQIYPLLEFVGGSDDEYKQILLNYINSNNLERQVSFVGQTNEPWKNVLKSDAVLICSHSEAFGRVTIEGMKAGRVVIASDTGAGIELLGEHSDRGFLFHSDDEVSLGEVFKSLWMKSNFGDMTKNAQHYSLENFSLSKHGSDLKSIIDSVL